MCRSRCQHRRKHEQPPASAIAIATVTATAPATPCPTAIATPSATPTPTATATQTSTATARPSPGNSDGKEAPQSPPPSESPKWHHFSGCKTSSSQLCCWPHSARHTTGDRMAAHRKLDRRRDDLCGGGLRKRASGRRVGNCYASRKPVSTTCSTKGAIFAILYAL